MTSLLLKLGENWHISHPYQKTILSVVPSTKYVNEIEDSLTSIYVAEHYDFKIYKTSSHHTVFDTNIDEWKEQKKRIAEEMKKEEDTLEKLSKKFEEVQKFLNPDLEEQEEEEEEEEVVEHPVERGKDRVKAQINKKTVLSKKEEEKRMAKQAKLTKANMASSQDKLLTLQKETDELDKKIQYYGYYRDAGLGFSRSIKRIVLSYEQTKDLEVLIKELADLHAYYDMMRRRYVPKEKCCGDSKLCDIHLLPLSPAMYSETGMIRSSRCSLYPV